MFSEHSEQITIKNKVNLFGLASCLKDQVDETSQVLPILLFIISQTYLVFFWKAKYVRQLFLRPTACFSTKYKRSTLATSLTNILTGSQKETVHPGLNQSIIRGILMFYWEKSCTISSVSVEVWRTHNGQKSKQK